MTALAAMVMDYLREAGFKDVRTANGVRLSGQDRGSGIGLFSVISIFCWLLLLFVVVLYFFDGLSSW